MILDGDLFTAVYWNDVTGGDSFDFHNTVFADVCRAKGMFLVIFVGVYRCHITLLRSFNTF